MTAQRIYADYNAQAPLRVEARAAVDNAMRLVGNASSVHAEGRRAKALLDDARDAVAKSVSANPSDVIFTSGATEANNQAVLGAVRALPASSIFVSAMEHDSIWNAVKAAGRPVESIPALSDGYADLDWLETRLKTWDAKRDGPPLISLMLVNNETGIVQPVPKAADIAHAAGGYVLCDAVQGLSRIKIDIESLGADFLTLSAHKIGGVSGSGALVVRGSSPMVPLIYGGGQERSLRAGTENLLGASSFGAACIVADSDDENARVRAFRDEFETALHTTAPGVRIVGDAANRIFNTSCVIAPEISAETAVVAMDLAGVACSAGSACSSGKVQRSRVLSAMGFSDQDAKSAIRFSFGWANQPGDGVAVAHKFAAVIRRARAQQAA